MTVQQRHTPGKRTQPARPTSRQESAVINLRYEFPHRLQGQRRARRELYRIERSQRVAHRRGDIFALNYLTRRHERAQAALAELRRPRH